MNLAQLQKKWSPDNLEASRALFPAPGSSPDLRTDMQRARLELNSGNPAVALELLHPLTPDEKSAPAHLFKGIAYWDLNEIENAEQALRVTLNIQQENNLAWSYLALCLYTTGRKAEAQSIWKERGFSDNLLYRVRLTEYVELQWLEHQEFFNVQINPVAPQYKSVSERKALKFFYKRDFRKMLEFLPESPGANEFHNFLSAIGWEMLQGYSRSEQFVAAMADKKSDWPDPLIALNARLLLRRGEIKAAAAELAKVETMGYEDYAVNYYLGIVCLAYGNRPQARDFFVRAYGNYMVDTQEFQWAEIQRLLLLENPPVVP